MTIKQEDGFAGLEPWASIEIANGECECLHFQDSMFMDHVQNLASTTPKTSCSPPLPLQPHAPRRSHFNLERWKARRSERTHCQGRVGHRQPTLHAQHGAVRCRTRPPQIIRGFCAFNRAQHTLCGLKGLNIRSPSTHSPIAKQPPP